MYIYLYIHASIYLFIYFFFFFIYSKPTHCSLSHPTLLSIQNKGAIIGAVASMAITAWLAFGQLVNKIQRERLSTVIDGCVGPATNTSMSLWTTETADVTTGSWATTGAQDGDV